MKFEIRRIHESKKLNDENKDEQILGNFD